MLPPHGHRDMSCVPRGQGEAKMKALSGGSGAPQPCAVMVSGRLMGASVKAPSGPEKLWGRAPHGPAVLAPRQRAAAVGVFVGPVRNVSAGLRCGTRPRSPAAMSCSAPGRPAVFVLLLLTLALFGLGFLNSLWWVAATVLVFVLLRHNRGGWWGRGNSNTSEYREYRDYRDQQDRWDRRYSRSRRGRWNRRERGPQA